MVAVSLFCTLAHLYIQCMPVLFLLHISNSRLIRDGAGVLLPTNPLVSFGQDYFTKTLVSLRETVCPFPFTTIFISVPK
jgi:hypothetical protein